MIPCAPITRLVDIFTRDKMWSDLKRLVPSPLGLAALVMARREVQRKAREYGGNNRGTDIDRYNGGPGGPERAWCAKFIYSMILWAAEEQERKCPIERTHGARALFRRIVRVGWRVKREDVQEGDFVLWARGPQSSWKAHAGIVSKVDGDRWWAICGNEGPYPAQVRETEKTDSKRLIGFARLP